MINIKNKLLNSDQFYGFSDFLKSRNWAGNKKDIVLADISPSEYRPFYLGANIIDAALNRSKYNCGRAIWEPGLESMEWFTEGPIKEFGVVAICAYMYYQLFGIPGFLYDNKIQPLAKNRKESDPIILLGGQMFSLTGGYSPFVDVACIGEGEELVLEIMETISSHAGTRHELLKKISKINGAYVPLFHGSDFLPRIKKRIIEKERLEELSKEEHLRAKHSRNVIEVARGCKYSCAFCSLARRMHPFRQIPFSSIKDKISKIKEGDSVYPFAPDEASYDERKDIVEWCRIRGLKVYHYNYRLNSVKKEDLIEPGLGGQIVFGIDGISQRVLNLVGKGIDLNRLLNEVAPEIFKNGFSLLKLNYVFNFSFESQEDYEELYLFWKKLIELRISTGSNCMIQIAPTPFLPEYFIPLQFLKINNYIDQRFVDTYNKIKHHFFDVLKIKPLFKMEGLQGEKNWKTSVIMHRVDRLGDLVYFCYKNGYKQSKYSDKLYLLILRWLALNKIKISDLFEELDTTKKYWFDKIDWACGEFSGEERVRRQFEKIKKEIAYNG